MLAGEMSSSNWGFPVHLWRRLQADGVPGDGKDAPQDDRIWHWDALILSLPQKIRQGTWYSVKFETFPYMQVDYSLLYYFVRESKKVNWSFCNTLLIKSFLLVDQSENVLTVVF